MRLLLFLVLFIASCKRSTKTNFDLDNSTLKITDGSNEFSLNRCTVRKYDDSLFLNFSDTIKQANWYELQIIKANNRFYSSLQNAFSISDSYKPPVFKISYQSIQLDHSGYEIGDSIKGTITLNILSYNRWPEVFTDTFKIVGGFRAVVQ